MNAIAKNRLAFVRQLAARHPEIYQRAVEAANKAVNNRRNRNGGQLGDATATNGKDSEGWFSRFLDVAGSLGTTYLQLDAQKKVLEANIERAKAGMSPIDVPVSAPTVRTQVEVAPDVVDKIVASGQKTMNNVLLFGGLAAAAFLLLR